MAFPPRETYEQFLYSLPGTVPEIRASSLHLYPNSSTTCFVRGSIWFQNGLELRGFEYLDLSDGEFLDYSYTVFRSGERIRWYDPQPHPKIPELASTLPHHYHAPPDIRRNRRPAPGVTFAEPNLPNLITEIASLSLPSAAASDDQDPDG
jgi:hypothetical protein